MILITQTTAPTAAATSVNADIFDSAGSPIIAAGGNLVTNIKDSSGNSLDSDGAGALKVSQQGSNGGTLSSISKNITMTGAADTLPALACKQVVLWSVLTNDNTTVSINSGDDTILEPGTSILIYTDNTNNIVVTGTSTQKLYYMVIS